MKLNGNSLKKALFIDRDGVINHSIVYKKKPFAPRLFEELKIISGVEKALIKSRTFGFLNIIISNQPDLSNKLISFEESNKINSFLRKTLCIDNIYICPHNNDDKCICRKPKPGLILKAAKDLKIDIKKSYMIGDRWKDIAAGELAGCVKCFFIDYGYNEPKPSGPYTLIKSLNDAVNNIID